MKLHLPVLLRKALLACFSFTFACTCSAAAADLTLGNEDSLTIDYADNASIPDLENGTLQLNGDTLLLLSNCGVGDGKTYTLLTGVSALRDAEGNAIVLDSSNNAISHYFDTTRPGVGFWADATLALTDDGTLQLVRHHETVKAAQTITTRQTESLVYSYYAGISFEDIPRAFSYGGAIYGGSNSTITLSDNACVVFSGNTASYEGGAIEGGSNSTITLSGNGSVVFSGNAASSGSILVQGGAIDGDTITLSNNGSVAFSGNTASATGSAKGGAIEGETITLSNNGSVAFSGNTASSGSSPAQGGAIEGEIITLSNNGSVSFSGNTSGSRDAWGGAIYGETITLSNNGSVTFSGNTASGGSYGASGGAIKGNWGTITLSNNGSVTFSGNAASSSDGAYGGAIYGNRTITLSNNGSVTFSGNTASGGSDGAGGGAICGGSRTLELSNNGRVEFCGNKTSSSSYHACGGAIEWDTITLSNNGSVAFSGNTASATGSAKGGAIEGVTITLSNNGSVTFSGNTTSSGSDGASGGAINVENVGTITLSNNGSVTFSGNTASGSGDAYGGAIFEYRGSPLKINNNGETIFRGNYAHSTANGAYGGAIYKHYGIFSIQNNASVVFEKNYALGKETLRLQSICASVAKEPHMKMLVNFSAPKGGKIEFRDSIHIDVGSNSASAFHLNNWYVDDAGERVAQTGDIIFTGEDATAENLKAILAEHGIHREATADEIRLSKTSEVAGTMQLHDGRLIVRDGAIIRADGITVHGSASGESTPTLWLDNGELTSYDDSSTRKNAVTISGGSALRLSGQNTAGNSTLTLSAGSTLIIDVAAAHITTAALTLNSSTLSLGGTITLQLNAAEGLNTAGRYMLLSGVSAPTDWANRISVSSGVWTIDDLSWVNNILYLNFSTLTEATWNNQSGDRLWNVNSSVNWEQHDIDYAYKDGIGVIFGDEGAGKVTLVGTLTPASVLVNSTGNYSFEGSGSLSGGMTLTKQGSGTLSISTANSYTGATALNAGTLNVQHSNALGATATATTATVTTAVGTTLSVDNKSHVILAAENDMKGAVSVAEGSTLEMRNKGYAAESSSVDGTLHFKGDAAATSNAGTLSGTGTVKVENSGVSFTMLKSFTGNMTVEGAAARLTIGSGNYSAAGKISVNGAGATLNMSSSNITMRSGGTLALSSDGEAAVLQGNNITITAGATLSVENLTATEVAPELPTPITMSTGTGAFDPSLAFNTTQSGVIEGKLLTLQQGAIYEALGGNIGLNGGELTLAITPVATQKIELILTLGAGYTEDSQVVLFTDVDTVNFIFDGTTAKDTSGLVYEFSADDYFCGDWVNESTKLVYDAGNNMLYVQNVNNVVPEPGSATLSLLALAALAARRRRK